MDDQNIIVSCNHCELVAEGVGVSDTTKLSTETFGESRAEQRGNRLEEPDGKCTAGIDNSAQCGDTIQSCRAELLSERFRFTEELVHDDSVAEPAAIEPICSASGDATFMLSTMIDNNTSIITFPEPEHYVVETSPTHELIADAGILNRETHGRTTVDDHLVVEKATMQSILLSTQLQLSSQNGHLHVVEALLARGADVNVPNETGWTPLHLAAQNGHLPVVEALLARGADVNVYTQYRWTPLHLAAQNGHLPVVEALLARGAADVNVRGADGWTPLHSAAQNGHLSVVEALLARGADVNLQSIWLHAFAFG